MGQKMTSCCNPTSGSSHQIELDPFDKNFLDVPLGAFRPCSTTKRIDHAMEGTLGDAIKYRHRKKEAVSTEHSERPEPLYVMDIKNDNGKTEQIYCRGEMMNNEAGGEVTLFFPRGEIFEGSMQAKEPVEGAFVFKKGCFYTGQISKFNAEGYGRYENSDSGFIYEGTWSKSLPHGKGKESYKNGDEYQGQLMYGEKFGQGTYRFADGKVYEGSFYYNQSDGKGTMTYPNQSQYTGEWKLGKYHGQGKFTWKNGEIYDGEYQEGVRQGWGRYTFRGGNWYEGEWEDGQQSGKGTFHEGYDDVVGEWEEGNLVN